jgi:sulfatase maturation enzyme AslB (radical SAM superfamily)
MLKISDITTIDIETINNCNARCPLCLRGSGMRTNDSLDWDRVVLNTPPELWQNLKTINFNGTTGDNLMNADIQQIVSWCVENTTADINIHTNGSLRDTDWWQQFGSMLQLHPHRVVFGIDGLEDTHAIYRIGTDYNKVIKNAQAFIKGGGQAEWQFIVFEHNAHQVNQAKQLAHDLGFARFFVMYQDRFNESADVPVQRYNQGLEKIDAEVLSNPSSKSISRRVAESDRKISCRSQQIGWLSIYADGTVWPCCWLMGWHRAQHQTQAAMINYHFKKILNIDFAQISLYNNTLESIINSDLWQKRYPGSFENSPNPICLQQCSGKK